MARIGNFASPGSMFKTSRHRSAKHLAAVRKLTCCACGKRPSDAHHVKIDQNCGMALRTGDDKTVPLCHACHMEEHAAPRTFWDCLGLSPGAIAAAIFSVSPDVEAMQIALNAILWKKDGEHD